jgi:transcriptional regulator with XRE-family HTH domain
MQLDKKGSEKMQDIKITLAAARVNSGLNQSEFAREMGVSLATVTNWEKGRTEPDATQLRKISQLSGIPMDYIFVQNES